MRTHGRRVDIIDSFLIVNPRGHIMFMRIIKLLLAHSINEPMKPKNEPNKAMQPMRMLVTNRAFSPLRGGTIRAKHTHG